MGMWGNDGDGGGGGFLAAGRLLDSGIVIATHRAGAAVAGDTAVTTILLPCR
jgi:hypothetical protein